MLFSGMPRRMWFEFTACCLSGIRKIHISPYIGKCIEREEEVRRAQITKFPFELAGLTSTRSVIQEHGPRS